MVLRGAPPPCSTQLDKTAALGSKAIGLFSTFRIVFPNFPAWILVSSDKLLMNRKNLVVEEVALFEKHFGLFSSFFPLSVYLAPNVGFGKTWYLRKSCDVYFPMAQILYHSDFWLRHYGFWNKSCRRDFLVGSLFSDADSGQLGDAFDELKEPVSRLVNYQTEDLHILFQMTVKWSIKSQWSSTMDLVKLRSNLVKLIKILLSLKRGLGLTDFNMFGYFQPVLALIGPSRFACRIPKKIFRVKMGL
uniref:Uncharacterized protein n=1 Tax=Fagus sylvatica TaxID=28930 RepID=A0A2N9ISE4_FAGSY